MENTDDASHVHQWLIQQGNIVWLFFNEKKQRAGIENKKGTGC